MRFVLPLIALSILSAPTLAAAADEDMVTVRIAYGDVDVSSAEVRAVLEARIAAKARKACTVSSTARYSYGRSVIDEKCAADARVAALAEVERVAAAETRSGRSVAAN